MSIFNEAENQETAPPTDAHLVAQIIQRMRSGSNWFYWVAGLSLLNSVILLAGGKWNFIVGLAVTQIIDVMVLQMSGQANGFNAFGVVGFMIDILVAGVFILFGFFAGKGSVAVFITGMVLYLFDAVLYLFVGDFLAAGFHGLALFFMFKGLMAAFELKTAVKNIPMVQS